MRQNTHQNTVTDMPRDIHMNGIHFTNGNKHQQDQVWTLCTEGLSLYHLGNNTGAIEYFDKVLAIDPQYVHAVVNKGGALMNLGNNTGAIPYFDKALAIDPQDAVALNNKGAHL